MRYLYFVRHGETTWNAENKICGRTDIPLTEKGHLQAIETGKAVLEQGIKPDIILYSPLVRAHDTALHISEITGIPVQPEPRLIEQSFGKFEGTPRGTDEFIEAKKNFLNRFGNGESAAKLCQRIYNLLDELRDDPERKTYMLVAHNGVARVVMSYFEEMSNEQYAFAGIKNCEIMKYDFDEA